MRDVVLYGVYHKITNGRVSQFKTLRCAYKVRITLQYFDIVGLVI